LWQFAEILPSKARKDDIIALWDGEEFVMALPSGIYVVQYEKNYKKSI